MAVLPFGLWDTGDAFNQAVDYEEEEEEQYEVEDATKKCQFEIKRENSETLHGKTLVVAVGNAANAFVDIYLDLPSKHVTEVVVKKEGDSLKTKKKDASLIFKLGENLICKMNSYLKPEDCVTWTETVLRAVKVEHVVILCSSAKSFFQGDEETKCSDADILRYLKSSIMNVNSSAMQLEEGNLVKDLPAALLSYCEAFTVPAVLYINYTESHFVDVFSVKAYQPVLSDDLMKKIPQASCSTINDKLKAFEGIGVADNNLYI